MAGNKEDTMENEKLVERLIEASMVLARKEDDACTGNKVTKKTLATVSELVEALKKQVISRMNKNY